MSSGEFYCKSFVILTRAVNVPDPYENLVSSPGLKRITLEPCDKIRLPIIYALCLKVYLSIKTVSGVFYVFL